MPTYIFIIMYTWICDLVLILIALVVELPSIHVSHQFSKEIDMLLNFIVTLFVVTTC